MIICYFGTYREEYSRNKIMIAALRSVGVEVKECHVSLWHGIEDRVNVTVGGWRSPKFWWRAVKAYVKLLLVYRKVGDYDVLMVGYPGQVDVFLARILANIRKKPLVWDVFMSLYLITKERKLDERKHSSVDLIKKIESMALTKPDLLIQDTAEYVKWFQREYGITPERFRLVPTGADDRIFRPLQKAKKQDDLFHVLYYGTFIPNHGVMNIVQAAQHLQDEKEIVFDMIGDGPERKKAKEFVRDKGLNNVIFYDWMKQEKLVEVINDADVCLGAFGDTPQSLMTVQNKIYECMAVGKPVITGRSPAVENNFKENYHLLSVDRNPFSIAEGVKYLYQNPKQKEIIAEAGKSLFYSKYNLVNLGRTIEKILEQTLNRKK
jgi:glycosyltransferase involved in cell wall biosynthesis